MLGFTLIELLITLSLIAILAISGSVLGRRWLDEDRATTQLDRVISAMQLARTEAIERGQRVAVCASKNGKTCSRDWSQGYMVFVDANANSRFDAGDILIRRYQGLRNNERLSWRGFHKNQMIVFEPTGMTRAGSGHFTYTTLTKPVITKTVVLNRMGKIRKP